MADQRDDTESWDVCVVPNRYPVCEPLASTNDASVRAQGVHEVVIESATHTTRLSELDLAHIYLMLLAYRDRFAFLSRQASIRFALAMKNSGRDAGASLMHTHSQIFGLPFVPEQMERELDGCERYFENRKRCVYCDLIDKAVSPSAQPTRLVGENESFVAWCPEASRFAYEVWIGPTTHQSRFDHASDDTLKRLAELLLSLARKIDQHPRIDAFNYLIHSLPFDSNRHDQYHWHIEVLPRIAKQAGFEWGTGIFINTVPPTQAANELRLDC